MQFKKKNPNKKITGHLVQYGETYNIAADGVHNQTNEFVKEQLDQAHSEAQKMLQEALLQVEQIIAKAENDASQILQQAQQEATNIQAKAQEVGQQIGYDQGYQAAYNQAVEEAQAIITSAETVITGAYQAQTEILMETEKRMLGLIVSIAKKVINTEITIQPGIILRITEAAIRELKDRDVVKIMVHPACVDMLTKASEILRQRVSALKVIKIIEDKSLPINGVIVESNSGRIDASIDTQVEEIFNRFLREAQNNPAQIQINQQQQQQIPPQHPPNTQQQRPPQG